MPLFRRMPKTGFNNARFRSQYTPVNIGDLDECFDDGAHVTVKEMIRVGLVRDMKRPVKVLGDGALTKRLLVEADKFSLRAAERIAAAGGEATVIEPGRRA